MAELQSALLRVAWAECKECKHAPADSPIGSVKELQTLTGLNMDKK